MLTPELIGLPEILIEEFQHFVFTKKEESKVQFYSEVVPNYSYRNGRRVSPFFKQITKARLVKSVAAQGEYVLNHLRGMIHEFDLEYLGVEDGVHIFYRAPGFTPSQGCAMFKAGENWYFDFTTLDPEEYLYKGVQYTQSDVAEMLGMTVDELADNVYVRFVAGERDPSQYLTSVFAGIKANSDGSYSGTVYVNGEPFSGAGYGRYITCYDQSGRDYVCEWKLYNGGLTYDGPQIPSGDERLPFVPHFNPENSEAILELFIQETPAQGKNWSVSAYFDLKTGKMIQRLRQTT